MRTSRLSTLLALAAIVAASASMAIAQDANTTTPTPTSVAPAPGPDHPCAPAANENHTAALKAWRAACVQTMTAYRRDAVESFNENRTLAMLVHEDNLTHIRATFDDGKLAAYEACLVQASPYGRNASGPHSGVLASCMKDKDASLRQAALAMHGVERQAIAASLKAARDNAKAQFSAMEQAWLAANPRP